MYHEWDTFGEGRYCYIRFGSGNPKYVIFPPTRELMKSLRLNPAKEAKSYRQMFPRHFEGTVYVMGYDPGVSAETWCKEIAQDFHQFLNDDFGRFNLIGISYGGAVAIPFAAFYPELVEKLALVVSAYGLSDEGVTLCRALIDTAETNGLYQVQKAIDSLILNAPVRWLTKLMHWWGYKVVNAPLNPPATFINAYTHVSGHPMGLKVHLDQIQAPTIVLGGTRDQFFSVERYKETEALIPDSRLVLIPNAGHPAPLERPLRAKRAIMDFLIKN